MILNRGRLVAMDRPDRLGGEGGGSTRVVGLLRMKRRPDAPAPGARVEKGAEEGLWRIEGEWSQETADDALRTLIAEGATVLEWRQGPATLEDVFRKLTLGEEDT